MKQVKDLREYLEILDGLNELQEIDLEVDWNLEIGAIIRRAYDLRAPAPLFNKIKDTEDGFRVLGGSAGLSTKPEIKFGRIAASLGFAPSTDINEIVVAITDAIEKDGIPPQVVDSGACQENIMLGDDVDLLCFPTPHIHDGDGGRYINTWGTIIAQTPDKSWTNWSINRIMLLDKNRMTGLVPPQQHLGIIHQMWADKGEPTPFALALGAPPAVPFFSGMPIPEKISEQNVYGALYGEGIPVVKCKTVDLHVPADSEIIIEGTISETQRVSEGPMGEFAGYMGAHDTPQPVYNVSAITYRNNPILPVVYAGVPVEDTQTCCGTMYSAAILHELRANDFPVTSCFLLFESAAHLLVVTVPRPCESMEDTHDLTHKAKNIIFKSKPGVDIPKVLLVDDDIDPSDADQVMWAIATRVHPQKDAHYYYHQKTLPLLHYLNVAEKKDMSSTKLILNGLIPGFDRCEISGFEYNVPEDLQKKVLHNWSKYGYK
ncbi:MAG: UbiD-like decarboxylase [Thermodesulfobacteriota bacterium]|nr:MAG: UbiD-like decarboxylase [Thermodesulfobacteriota bacterium]